VDPFFKDTSINQVVQPAVSFRAFFTVGGAAATRAIGWWESEVNLGRVSSPPLFRAVVANE
jgi:hypothetical protein